MRLFNQTKNQLRWSMGGQSYEADPWGTVTPEIPDGLVSVTKSMGLPLSSGPAEPAQRARQQVADDAAERSKQALFALRKQVDEAAATERYAREQLDARDIELSTVRSELRELKQRYDQLRDKLTAAKDDAKAAEGLLAEQSAKAAAAEERAIKAEALLHEHKTKPAKRTG